MGEEQNRGELITVGPLLQPKIRISGEFPDGLSHCHLLQNSPLVARFSLTSVEEIKNATTEVTGEHRGTPLLLCFRFDLESVVRHVAFGDAAVVDGDFLRSGGDFDAD